MIGTILGERYEILEEIGKGGMAYVYKARCVLLNRIVAVKVLRDDLDGGDEFLSRFNTEAQAAASLTHSNIVSIFDVGEDNGKHYIVMEYVDGITLKEYINERKQLAYKEALDIVYQICDALQAAHEKNIVHRDIKPHNILVTDERNIKVADFGIARSGSGKTLASDNDILGSVHYISPEQAKGDTVDNRSDLYSLGIVLYELLSGVVPFDAETPVAVAMMQIEQRPSVAPLEAAGVPISVQQIVFKAIAKNSALRYRNALEFKTDILNVIEDVSYVIPDGEKYVIPKQEEQETIAEEVVEIKKGKKFIAIFCGIISALLIVFAFVSVFHMFFSDSQDNNIISASEDQIPSLVGKTLEEAQKICESKGYRLFVSDEISDSNYKPGTIISQKPQEGEVFKKGTVINIVINKSENSLLEDYSGNDYRQAQKELEELGYEVNVIFEESKKDEDVVLRQSPEAGIKHSEASTITLYVSKGMQVNDKYKTVPTLVGAQYDKAVKLLNDNGLVVGEISGVTAPAPGDVVMWQAIPAGSMVEEGSAVALKLKGTGTVQEPVVSETPNDTDVGTDEQNVNANNGEVNE